MLTGNVCTMGCCHGLAGQHFVFIWCWMQPGPCRSRAGAWAGVSIGAVCCNIQRNTLHVLRPRLRWNPQLTTSLLKHVPGDGLATAIGKLAIRTSRSIESPGPLTVLLLSTAYVAVMKLLSFMATHQVSTHLHVEHTPDTTQQQSVAHEQMYAD